MSSSTASVHCLNWYFTQFVNPQNSLQLQPTKKTQKKSKIISFLTNKSFHFSDPRDIFPIQRVKWSRSFVYIRPTNDLHQLLPRNIFVVGRNQWVMNKRMLLHKCIIVILLSSSGPGPSPISISKLKKRTRADIIIQTHPPPLTF